MTGFYKYGTAGHTETELVTDPGEAVDHEYCCRGDAAEHPTWEATNGYFACLNRPIK